MFAFLMAAVTKSGDDGLLKHGESRHKVQASNWGDHRPSCHGCLDMETGAAVDGPAIHEAQGLQRPRGILHNRTHNLPRPMTRCRGQIPVHRPDGGLHSFHHRIGYRYRQTTQQDYCRAPKIRP